jgi:hypothetical protein
MTISKDYEKYLSHFSETVTLDEFHRNSLVPGLCALRHDVDHDLDLALEMAHFERERGFSSTYFILPGTNYWRTDTRLIDKCLQLQDYGHEVGLHVNSLAEWVSGETNDISASLREQLATLRDAGIRIHGIAAHGDKRCYEHQLSNYWCFQELRPALPYDHENGRTAEGPYETDGTPRLRYPKNHIATRADGTTLELWSTSMQSLGLRYHAWHTAFDQYFSDSTGGWKRTPDPLTVSRSNSRWQVLIHPEHWRGAKRYYFFLSSARSGSKWLSELLDTATPLKTRHEYILNQAFHRGETARKGTSDIWSLEDDANEVRARLVEAWEEFQQQPADFAEVNVYLEDFTDLLKAAFPDATFVHLKRNPKLVVSSLMDRNWYDTPEDRRHPRLVGANPAVLSQFERVCHYVAQVEYRLSIFCSTTVQLTDLTTSNEVLARTLHDLGVPYHPILGRAQLPQVSNARVRKCFPDPDDWDEQKTFAFNRIFNAQQAMYVAKVPAQNCPKNYHSTSIGSSIRHVKLGEPPGAFRLSRGSTRKMGRNNCEVIYEKATGHYLISTDLSSRNAYISIGGSHWERISRFLLKNSGWPIRPESYISGSIVLMVPISKALTIYAISYNSDGTAIHRRNIGVVDSEHPKLNYSCAPHPLAVRVDFIIYISAKFKPFNFNLISFMFCWQNQFTCYAENLGK